MKIEVNKLCVDETICATFGAVGVMITPPIDEDYWLFRVPVSDSQALLAFPKFGTIGIGFQKEEDWNSNLPYSCEMEKIFQHIEHNRGEDNPSDDLCREAISLLQKAAIEYKAKESVDG